MPTAPAYARKLLRQGKAVWQPHHAFSVIRLTRLVEQPSLRSIVVGIDIQLDIARLYVVADGNSAPITLFAVTVDLRTDLVRRLRRRAEHRRRRRARGRYHASNQQGVPYKRRRPSMLRSRWRHQHPVRTHSTFLGRTSPVMVWRSQAILRTLRALQQLLPISDVVILNTADRTVFNAETNLRERLIEAYGTIVNGQREPICAYCGTTTGIFVIDHVTPQSRGGTDAWSNVVLACTRCNDRKGDRTPKEAGMVLRDQPKAQRGNRANIYRRATQTALAHELRRTSLRVHNGNNIEQDQAIIALVLTLHGSLSPTVPHYFAKPISRGAKQRYTARNYPLTTILKPGWERRAPAIKRRTRVNDMLRISRSGQKNIVTIVGPDRPGQATNGSPVRVGMLCEGKRAGKLVTGIVAIESSGRLRLIVAQEIQAGRIHWKRVLIAPRQHLRILATESVIFLRAPQPDVP